MNYDATSAQSHEPLNAGTATFSDAPHKQRRQPHRKDLERPPMAPIRAIGGQSVALDGEPSAFCAAKWGHNDTIDAYSRR